MMLVSCEVEQDIHYCRVNLVRFPDPLDIFKSGGDPVYVNVDTPNLGVTYFNFLGGAS